MFLATFEHLDLFNASNAALQRLEWSVVKTALCWKFPTVRQVSTDTLNRWLEPPGALPPLLLDTRTPEEYAVSHLYGAQRADTAQEVLHLLRDYEEDRLIVIYCSIGYRSSEIVKQAQAQGFTNMYNLEGGLFAWAHAGHPLYRGNKQVRVVHPYDEQWGQLLDKALWAWTA